MNIIKKKKKSNYLRDVTHLVRDKEQIYICKCCYLQLFVECMTRIN